MNELKKAEFKVGLISLLAITILFMIIYWGKSISLGADKIQLSIEFDNVAGLEKGDAVSVNGVKKGKVTDIILDNNKSIVKVYLDKPIDLREDATFYITMIDLMGGKKVDIHSGKSPNPLDYNALHKGYFAGDIPYLVSEVTKLSYKIPIIMDEISLTLKSVNTLLNDKDLLPQLKATLNEVKDLTSNLNEMVQENKKSIKEIASNTAEISHDTKEFIKTNRDDISKTIKDVNRLTNNLNHLTLRIDSLVAETTNKRNNLGKLIYDENYLKELKNTTQQIKQLIDILQNQLENDGVKVKAKINLW